MNDRKPSSTKRGDRSTKSNRRKEITPVEFTEVEEKSLTQVIVGKYAVDKASFIVGLSRLRGEW